MPTRSPTPFRTAVAAALLLATGGCTWANQRLDDLGDCFLWRWHGDALGAAIEAKVGPLDAAIGGWYADGGVGKDTWWQRPGETMTNQGIGLPFTTFGPLAWGDPWENVFATSSLGNHPGAPDAFTDVRGWLGISDVFDLDEQYPYVLSPARRVSDLFGVEVGVVPAMVALRVGFNVAEFADLLLGCVFLDIFGDDGVERPATKPYAGAR